MPNFWQRDSSRLNLCLPSLELVVTAAQNIQVLLRKWKNRKQPNKNLEGQLWLRKGQKKENWEEVVNKVNIRQKLPSNSIWKGMSRHLDPNTYFIPSIRKNINASGWLYSLRVTLPQITHLLVTIKIEMDLLKKTTTNYPEKHQLWTSEPSLKSYEC